MELHAITPEGRVHVCDIHRGSGDLSPLQMISAQELRRLQQAEAELAQLREELAALRDAAASLPR